MWSRRWEGASGEWEKMCQVEILDAAPCSHVEQYIPYECSIQTPRIDKYTHTLTHTDLCNTSVSNCNSVSDSGCECSCHTQVQIKHMWMCLFLIPPSFEAFQVRGNIEGWQPQVVQERLESKNHRNINKGRNCNQKENRLVNQHSSLCTTLSFYRFWTYVRHIDFQLLKLVSNST